MAILPNKTENLEEKIGKEVIAGPKKLTVEEYLVRLSRKQEAKLTAIPKIILPKKHKRGGKLVQVRRKLAALKATVEADPPPEWNIATEIWQQIIGLEREMNEYRHRKTQRKQGNNSRQNNHH